MENLRGRLTLENEYDITRWFNDQQHSLKRKKDSYISLCDGSSNIFLNIWLLPFVCVLVTVAPILAILLSKPGLVFIATSLSCLLGSGIATFFFQRKRKKKHQEMDKEFYQNKEYGALRKRASVLLPALHEYHYHRDCYQQLYDLMERNIVEKKPEEMERYASFIKHADSILASAVNNFLAVLKHMNREVEYRKDQPQNGTTDRSSLVLLLEAIGDNTVHQDPGTLLKPLTTLQNEEALLEVMSELKTPPVHTHVSA